MRCPCIGTFISNSANGLTHSLAEFYSMKLFFPNRDSRAKVLIFLVCSGFIEVLLFIYITKCMQNVWNLDTFEPIFSSDPPQKYYFFLIQQ